MVDSRKNPLLSVSGDVDVHHLVRWAAGLESLAEDYARAPEDAIIFRPDDVTSDAMMRLGIRYDAIIRRLRDYIESVERLFDDFCLSPNEWTRQTYQVELGNLARVAGVAVKAIDESRKLESSPMLTTDEVARLAEISPKTLNRHCGKAGIRRTSRGENNRQFSAEEIRKIAAIMSQSSRKDTRNAAGKLEKWLQENEK